MANFIDRLSEQVAKNKETLKETLRQDASPHEQDLQRLVKGHWHKLPKTPVTDRRPAYAVDGSRAVRHLANGAYLFVAQALIVGEVDGKRQDETEADVQILPGTAETPFVERFAELMMHSLETKLARRFVNKMQKAGVLFVDGALYGMLPQLYPLGTEHTYPEDILSDYRKLFKSCEEGKLILISIAKTSRESTHTRVWWKHEFNEEMPDDQEIPANEAIYRWTNRSAGFSTPILLGQRAFSKQPESAVQSKVKDEPAIVSFFVRLADFDDALRIDVPAVCIGRSEKIADIKVGEEILLKQTKEVERINPIIEILQADYGGFEVYNALMYSVDREVRLRQDIMDQVYLSLIQNSLGSDVEVRLDRSERRFHSR